MQAKFGAFESYPARFTDYEAWVLIKGEWTEFHVAEVRDKAKTLSETAFKERFGQLPALPKTSFHSGE